MTRWVAETEREHRLHDFAARLLSWPDPEGPSSVDLIPEGYPDDLPRELVDHADLRFLGSVVHRRNGDLLQIELLFEYGGSPNELLERYEAGLLKLGWKSLRQPGLSRGGFEGGGFGASSTLVNKQMLRAYLQTFDGDKVSLLRVHYRPPREGDLPDPPPETLPEPSPLPALRPPPGVRMRSEGSGGGGGRWSSGATATTEMAPMELEAYFAKQMESAGWGRVDGSADEFFAWSGWLAPQIPPSPRWRAVLVVHAAFPGERWLSLRADLPDRR